MMSLAICKLPTFPLQQQHRQKRTAIKMMAEGRESLDFRFISGFPASNPKDDFQCLKTVFQDTVDFPLRKVMLYESPKISPKLMNDIATISHLQQCLRTDPPNPHYVSLSAKIQESVPPPRLSNGLIDMNELTDRVAQGKYGTIFLDPIMGLGDVRSFARSDVRELRFACYTSNTLLVLDEMTCGLGRTGPLWAHSSFGILPDALLTDFGSEIGIRAMLVNDFVAPGGSFYLTYQDFIPPAPSCKEAAAVLLKVTNPHYRLTATTCGGYLKDLFTRYLGLHPQVKEVRSFGLIVALELHSDASGVALACKEHGLLVDHVPKAPNLIGLMPPADATRTQLDHACDILQDALHAVYN